MVAFLRVLPKDRYSMKKNMCNNRIRPKLSLRSLPTPRPRRKQAWPPGGAWKLLVRNTTLAVRQIARGLMREPRSKCGGINLNVCFGFVVGLTRGPALWATIPRPAGSRCKNQWSTRQSRWMRSHWNNSCLIDLSYCWGIWALEEEEKLRKKRRGSGGRERLL